MKKKISAVLASVLAFACVPLNLTASAEYDSWFLNDKPYVLETENFTYKPTRPVLQPTPESGIECNANFMITGVYHYTEGEFAGKAGTYTAISFDLLGNDRGYFYTGTLEPYLDNADELNVGDLLYISHPSALEIFPPIFTVDKWEGSDTEVKYLGNGLDIFGDEFLKVMRHEANYDSQIDDATLGVLRGDATEDETVNILDVITINKNILGRETLSCYARHVSDVDENGTVDSNDALNVLKYIVGLKENLEVEE